MRYHDERFPVEVEILTLTGPILVHLRESDYKTLENCLTPPKSSSKSPKKSNFSIRNQWTDTIDCWCLKRDQNNAKRGIRLVLPVKNILGFIRYEDEYV